jgi:uncharacterized coiled-coil protein SlyX
MSSEEWSTIKARIKELEQVVRALQELRTRTALPYTTLNALNNAIAENKKLVERLKQAMVN